MKPIKWIAVHLACLTMIFSPIAMGKEAEEINKAKLQQMIKEFGLNKKITLGEFWENSKAYIPVTIYKDLEAFVKENKNLQMPEVTLDISKATDGAEIPVVQFTQNGKTQNVQFYGQQNKWAKFNSVVLSISDLNRVENAFKRIEASDIKLKNEADKYRKNQFLKQRASLDKIKATEYKKDFARFKGFPRVTPQLWKSLTKEQRAGYIVKMRLMWMNARKVLANLPNSPIKKTKEAAAIENFYNIIFQQEVRANSVSLARVPGKVTPAVSVRVNGTSVKTKTGIVNIPYDAKSCVVAGYIGAYAKVNNINGDNRAGCSVDLAVATYKSDPNLKFVQVANDSCAAQKPTMLACHPIIYGYPNGSPACIDRKSAEYQHATHFTSPANRDTCDGKSRLSSSDEIIKFNDKNYANVQPREKQIAAIEADQQKDDYSLTQSYLKGVLTQKDPILLALLEKGEWNLALDEELVRIQSQFEQEIERAIKTCENDISSKHEENQKLACDQLHRRWLFTERSIANLRDKACLKPALYIGNYSKGENSFVDAAKEKTNLNKKTIDFKGTDLCECPSQTGAAPEAKAKVKRVNFAEACEVPISIAEVVPKPIPLPKCDKPEAIAGFNYDECKCEDNKKLSFKPGSSEGNSEGDIGGYECEGRNWLPWILGGAALVAFIAFFHRHKKPNVPALPPAEICTPPKIGAAPNCACPAASSFCTPPQNIYNLSTCQCTNIPQPPRCADDSIAPNANLAQCPTCPPSGVFRTTAGCPSEGGTGNNTCTNPPCSGGLPGTGN